MGLLNEQARLELGERIVAGGAGKARREQVLAPRIEFKHQGPAIGVLERRFERFRQALLCVGSHLQPVDHHFYRVLGVL